MTDTPTPLQWQEETFYFGNANWPPYETYRTYGDKLQFRVEINLEVRCDNEDNPYDVFLNTPGILKFLQTYIDCKVSVHPGYTAWNGVRVSPSAYLIGWLEVTDSEEHAIYREIYTREHTKEVRRQQSSNQ